MSLISELIKDKHRGKKWAVLTAYDAPTAGILEAAGVDMLLVGDSLGMVVLGYDSTATVTMDEMIHHAKAVRRGAPDAFVIGDMPLKAVEKGPGQALLSAGRFIEEAGCDAVKLEWRDDAIKICGWLVKRKIPVMGHVGLTPQKVTSKEGFKVQGQNARDAIRILKNARAFEEAGAFSIVLECVPSPVSKRITETLKIPTIGIGAGPHCDGQVLVIHDVMGIFKKFSPRFVKRYANLDLLMKKAVQQYAADVREGRFPGREHEFGMKKEEELKFRKSL